MADYFENYHSDCQFSLQDISYPYFIINPHFNIFWGCDEDKNEKVYKLREDKMLEEIFDLSDQLNDQTKKYL